MENWNWRKIFGYFRDVTWILMIIGYWYLWFYVSPEYINYKEKKEIFQNEVVILKADNELLQQRINKINKSLLKSSKEYEDLELKKRVVDNNLIRINERLQILKEARELKNLDSLTNEEMDIMFDSMFGDIINSN